ncbi:MAG: V-type ATP synthase subunit D [Clostridia bacterium]|nr:V-type ATP synthase subunit D [Clostridia bacterium]
MARLNVNPTRMALSGLKKSLGTASRGYRLLKDKRDELMRQFLETVREAKDLRQKVETEFLRSQRYLQTAAGLMGEKELKTALLIGKGASEINVGHRNVMSVILPQFSDEKNFSSSEIHSFGYANTSADLDRAVELLYGIKDDLLRLAELEKQAALMSAEIEHTVRRVNALEHIIIPDYMETMRYIRMKLDENERENSIRLLKVKDLVLAEKLGK